MRTLFRSALVICLAIFVAGPALVFGQGDGARMYWKGLAGMNAVTFWPGHLVGNFNPFDPSFLSSRNADFQANTALIGYHKVLPLFGRSATASLLLTVGNLQGETVGDQAAHQQSASGFGDPMFQLVVNVLGAPAILDLPTALRYEPEFTVDLLAAVAIPIGEYYPDQPLNIGQNRWYGRIGAPTMYRLGAWIPGERTTIEIVPALWLFGNNNEFNGQTLKTDPMLQLEGHLTRDFTETFWGSLDVAWYTGAKAHADSLSGEDLNNLGAGITFGFTVTDNLSLNMSYFSTIRDTEPEDLKGDQFRLMFTYAWHPLLEAMKRLKGHE